MSTFTSIIIASLTGNPHVPDMDFIDQVREICQAIEPVMTNRATAKNSILAWIRTFSYLYIQSPIPDAVSTFHTSLTAGQSRSSAQKAANKAFTAAINKLSDKYSGREKATSIRKLARSIRAVCRHAPEWMPEPLHDLVVEIVLERNGGETKMTTLDIVKVYSQICNHASFCFNDHEYRWDLFINQYFESTAEFKDFYFDLGIPMIPPVLEYTELSENVEETTFTQLRATKAFIGDDVDGLWAFHFYVYCFRIQEI